MKKFDISIPISLYIHLPWCVKKCPYCDFNSHEAKNTLPEERYIETLLRDFDENSESLQGRSFDSIFFGGGTPSLFLPESIEKIITAIDKRFPLSSSIEITLEANPGTVDTSRFIGFKKAGINRLSLGIQSLQNDKLISLGRIHDRDSAVKAIDAAQRAGFENMNIDIMHGLPNQSTEDALFDLQEALRFQTPHLSWYQLTIEPNTFFYRNPPTLPTEDTVWNMETRGKEMLQQAGLFQYEVSAYAKKGKACTHNKNYWEFGDYLGIGAGAHSKITDLKTKIISRHSQTKNPRDYLDPTKKRTLLRHELNESDCIFEFMLNGLRLIDGIEKSLFIERTGLSIKKLEPILHLAKQKKLLLETETTFQPTKLGQRFLNDLIGMFLPK